MNTGAGAGRWAKSLYVQVLVAVVAGILVGHFRPSLGVALQPLGDGFIQLVRMMIAPIVFVTVVGGIARMRDMRKAGRVGLKALVYFEVLTTVALGVGLLVGEVLQPGSGAVTSGMDAASVAKFDRPEAHPSGVAFVFHEILPETLVGAFADGKILQVLLLSILFGAALAALGEKTAKLVELVEQLGDAVFKVFGYLMRLAPLGALGAMAFTVGRYGLATLGGLGKLMGTFYLTSLLFVVVVLGLVCRWVGVSVFQLMRYLRQELVLVLGTSSSESALTRLMEKMEALGCPRPIVDLVLPAGYSFNLDGTSIYLTLATLFIAQALRVHISLADELKLLFVLLLTSKGAAAVTGGGFVVLAATLASTGKIPVAGLALVLGVDRFMSEARALTNLVGNSVAALVMAKWEGELDLDQARERLRRRNPS